MSREQMVADFLGGKAVLGEGAKEPRKLLEKVRSGLPYKVFEITRSKLAVDKERLQVVLGVPARTLARRKIEKVFTKEESDRLYRLARIAALATDVLGDRERAMAWLRAENRSLGGRVPIDLLDTDLGAEEVEDILGRIDHGIFG